MAVKNNKKKSGRSPQKPVSSRAVHTGGTPAVNRRGAGRNTSVRSSAPGAVRASSASPKTRKKTGRAVKRAMNSKSVPHKRHRRRYGSYILYYLLAGVVVVIVFIVLANTLLFNCSSFETEGSIRYTGEELIEKSGIKQGDNLLHIDTKKAEDAIVSSLAYIDTAKVSKVFPTKIKITVVEAEKWYCIEQDGMTAAISRGGKIVEHASAGGLPVITGFEAQTIEVGQMLQSEVHEKNAIPAELLNAAEAAGIDRINSIDITDRFDISILVDNRMTLLLGSAADAGAKLNAAKTVMGDIAPTEKVSILVTDPEKVAVKPILPEPIMPDETDEAVGTGESAETSQTGETGETAAA